MTLAVIRFLDRCDCFLYKHNISPVWMGGYVAGVVTGVTIAGGIALAWGMR